MSIDVKLDTPGPIDNTSAKQKDLDRLVDQVNEKIRTLQRNIELLREKAQEAP